VVELELIVVIEVFEMTELFDKSNMLDVTGVKEYSVGKICLVSNDEHRLGFSRTHHLLCVA